MALTEVTGSVLVSYMLGDKQQVKAMPKARQFTRNESSAPVEVVVDKITHFERDELSKCTIVHVEGGETIAVSKSAGGFRKVVNDASWLLARPCAPRRMPI